jgi:NitT/TauT family transport system permease protein
MVDHVNSSREIQGFSVLGQSAFSRDKALDVALILGVAVALIGALELYLRLAHVPTYIMPRPSAIALALRAQFWDLLPHVGVTLFELLAGFLIGASIGFILAMIVTQFPWVERIVTPYILLMVTTPMIALVPLLILRLGFGPAPRIVAVALAAGPMVMLNSVTGFRRVDEIRLDLARAFGASTLQTFLKIRIPQALPMVIAGLTVGAIFGLLTAVAAEMAGGQEGIGTRLVYHSSMLEMPEFFATIVVLAVLGIAIHAFFTALGRFLVPWTE